MKKQGFGKFLNKRVLAGAVSYVFLSAFSVTFLVAGSVEGLKKSDSASEGKFLSLPTGFQATEAQTAKELLEKVTTNGITEAQVIAWLQSDASKSVFDYNADTGLYTLKGTTSSCGLLDGALVVGPVNVAQAYLSDAAAMAAADISAVGQTLVDQFTDALVKTGAIKTADAAAKASVKNGLAALNADQIKLLKDALAEGFYFLSNDAAAQVLADWKASNPEEASKAVLINDTVNIGDQAKTVILQVQESFDPGTLIHELVEAQAANKANGLGMLEAHKAGVSAEAAYSLTANASNFASALADASDKIAVALQNKDMETVVAALQSLLADHLDQLDEGMKSRISDLINEKLMQTGNAALDKDLIQPNINALREIANELAAGSANIATFMSTVALDESNILEALAGKKIANNNWVMDETTYQTLLASDSSMAQEIAKMFENNRVASPNDLNENSILVASTSVESAVFVDAARQMKLPVHQIDSLDIENLRLFERVAITAQSPEVIRNAFFSMSPAAQVVLRQSYGSVLVDILDGKYATLRTLNDELAGTIILNMQINSELAAAIKA